MSTHGFFTSEGLQRLQKILDDTCDDLGISRDGDYAVSSRDFLAKQLFHIQALGDFNTAQHNLSNFARRYGFRTSRAN